MEKNKQINFFRVFGQLPTAAAVVQGSAAYPSIHGTVRFYQTAHGVIVAAELSGLPASVGNCGGRIFAFHIHEGGACSGNTRDPFADAGAHDNPYACPHPAHAGDLPPLFGTAEGRAIGVCLTDRFTVDAVLGKTVILHDGADDFTTQPAGNAGSKIACGVITRVRR